MTIGRTILVLAATAQLGIAGSALGQAQPPSKPAMDYGHTDVAPKNETVGEKADQIRLSFVLGRAVYARQDGTQIGTVETALLDRDGGIAAVVLKPARAAQAKGPITVAWASLQPQAKPSPRFVTDLAPEDTTGAAAARPQDDSLVDARRDLIGKKATGANGKILGTVRDAVVTFDGKLVALAVETGAGPKPKTVHAVPWSSVRIEGEGKDKKIALDMTPQQLAAAPVMTTKAPEPRETPSTGSSVPPTAGSRR